MKLIQSLRNNSKLDCAFFGAIAGAIIFILLYGFLPLDVTNDRWIINGYVEADIRQHYAGWLAFRNAEWSWPLGYTDKLAYPDGTIISFTDSIPLVAIFFKLINGILPEVFQYFGLYVLICFVLQGVSATYLLSEFTNNRRVIKLTSFLFIISPIMIERAFRHTGLASHFLILFSWYLYFHSRHNSYRMEWGYSLLLGLAIAIHPYFLPMIFGIFCANILEMLLNKVQLSKVITYFIATFIPCVVVGVVIGVIGAGVSVESSGYGLFSMNMNALWNPLSLGNIEWSTFLQPLPQILGNYDGFNYLGLGIIMGCMAVPICVCIKKIKIDNNFIKNNIGIVIAAVVFTIFALSNVLTYNDKKLILFTLPEPIYHLFSIFRASSRMFYPVYYIIYLVVVLTIIKCITKKNIMIGLGLLLCVQVVDIYPGLYEKHNSLKLENVSKIYQDNYEDIEKYWGILRGHYSEIRFIETKEEPSIAVFISKENFEKANFQISNRGVYNNEIAENAKKELLSKNYKKDVLYATLYENTASLVGECLPEDLTIYDLNGCYVISKKIQELSPVTFEHIGTITLSKISDNNWNKGVNRLDQTMWLFEYNDLTEHALLNSTYLVSKNKTYEIISISTSEDFITVRVNDELDAKDTEETLYLKPSLKP